MGQLVNGVWRDEWYDAKSSGGHFQRQDAVFRNWVTADGSPGPSGVGGFKAEPGRYHLYVSLACPWAHRTLIFRALKGLESMIGVEIVHPHMAEEGWTFATDFPGATGDRVHHKSRLYEIYLQAKPDFSGRVTVPVLWDTAQGTIVSNESAEIIRMFNSAFDGIGARPADFYPLALRPEIDAVNERVYNDVNNGVYKAGFATTQAAYDRAYTALFEALDGLDERLGPQRYLAGENPDRGRLAALHDIGAVRRGLSRALQMQQIPHRRLPQSVELPARAVPISGRRRHRQPRSHQAPLLRLAPPDQSDRHRPARAGAKAGRAA